MPTLPGYEATRVAQKAELSCIAAGVEWAIRYLGFDWLGLTEDQINGFQAAFDQPNNSFLQIKDAVRAQFPQLIFEQDVPPNGQAKIDALRDLIGQRRPVLLSLVNPPGWKVHLLPGQHARVEIVGSAHIMPVVAVDEPAGTLRAWEPQNRLFLEFPTAWVVEWHGYKNHGTELLRWAGELPPAAGQNA